MTDPAPKERERGEMPFLDHLEELRWRLVKALAAVFVGVGIGYAFVINVDVIAFLKRPINPLLPEGERLVFTSPMDPFILSLKLAVVIGAVLALPVILWQVWGFLRPALYDRERKTLFPVTLASVLLFVIGAGLGFYVVLPMALPILFGFATASLQPMITAQSYFGFLLAIVLAFGAVFEVPLVMFVLIYLRLISAAFLRKQRRTFTIINAIASSVLTPGDLIVMTLITMIPIQLFYELSIVMAVIMERRRARAEQAEAEPPTGVPAAGQA